MTSNSQDTPAPQARTPLRIRLNDTLSMTNRHALKMAVVDAIAGGQQDFVIDAADCHYVDSSGLGALVSANKKAKDAGGSMVIEGLAPDLLEYFRIINLDTIFTLRSAAL